MNVAELYETYMNRLKSGEYVPARPKCLLERKMKEEQISVTEVRK